MLLQLKTYPLLYTNKNLVIHPDKNIVHHCAIVLLAAGSSARLGKPKQLLKFNGKSLLQQTINSAGDTGINPLIVVVGANASLLSNEIETKKAHTVFNKHWQTGMASSINSGLNFLIEKYPLTDGVIFMMCDQPFVSAGLLKNLIIVQKQTGKPIVCSSYQDVLGVPAIFHKNIFPELLKLKGDTGARKIIQQHPHELATVQFLKGNIDIDTAEDYENLLL